MLQVYTGAGKGKTTASLGLALRASGAGLKVYIGQFIKKGCYSEVKLLRKIKNITLEQYGRGCFIKAKPTDLDQKLAEAGLAKAAKAILSGKYQMVILDEINIVLSLGILNLNDVINIVKDAPKKLELIFTGRNAPLKIIEIADLVSEIMDKKHYYKSGVKARKGIEF